ncbi:N-alpha-acetyltransferase 35, NatC auxiliary subunit [Schizosaccharomyces pombe]
MSVKESLSLLNSMQGNVKIGNVEPAKGNEGYVDNAGYVDCTKSYFEATKSLKEEQLVCDPKFTLLDSISAFEIMEPKMDSGIDYQPLRVDFSRDLSYLEILALMDLIVSAEKDWHYGSPLSESLLCSAHVFSICKSPISQVGDSGFSSGSGRNTTDIVLFPFVLAVIKCCDIVHREFLMGNLYDEEDISSFSYHMSFLQNYPIEKLNYLLQSSIEYLASEVIKFSAELRQIIEGILNRIQLRIGILRVYERSDIKTTIDALHLIKNLVPEIQNTVSVVDSSIKESILKQYWDFRVQAQLVATAPVRNIPPTGIEHSYQRILYFADDMLLILNSHTLASSLAVYQFCLDFTRLNRTPEPYVRSSLQALITANNAINLRDQPTSYMLECIHEFSGLPSNFYNPNTRTVIEKNSISSAYGPLVESLIAHSTNIMVDLVRICSHNPCRFRRNLINLLPEITVAHFEAEALDLKFVAKSLPSNGPFSSFIYHVKLNAIEHILLSSFEQKLHQPYQWPHFFAVLDHVFSIHQTHLELHGKDRNTPPMAKTFVAYLHRILNAIKETYSGYLLLTVLCMRLNIIKTPSFTLDEKIQESYYMAHYRPLINLRQPKPLLRSEADCIIKNLQNFSTDDLIIKSNEKFTAAKNSLINVIKSGFEQNEFINPYFLQTNYLKNLLCCCITNLVSLAILSKDHSANLKIVEIPGNPLPSLSRT